MIRNDSRRSFVKSSNTFVDVLRIEPFVYHQHAIPGAFIVDSFVKPDASNLCIVYQLVRFATLDEVLKFNFEPHYFGRIWICKSYSIVDRYYGGVKDGSVGISISMYGMVNKMTFNLFIPWWNLINLRFYDADQM